MVLGAFLLNTVLTPVVLFLAHRFGWYDEVDHRKIHVEDTPRLGGLGIIVSFSVTVVLAFVLVVPPELNGLWPGSTLLMALAGLLLIHLLGLYDDFVNLRAPFKFGIQLLAALLPVLAGLVFRVVQVPVFGEIQIPLWIAVPATIFWIVSIANAVNLIDGADGMAGGIALIAAFFMGIIGYGQGMLLPAVFAFALVGSLAGFLVYNAPPAKIFMGDGGSLSLGFILAVIPLFGISQNGSAGAPTIAILPVVTLLFIPVADTLMAIIRRIRRGEPIHTPDREHLHHRLIDRGLHGHQLLAVVYTVMIVLGLISLTWFFLPANLSAGIIVAAWIAFVTAAVKLGRSRI